MRKSWLKGPGIPAQLAGAADDSKEQMWHQSAPPMLSCWFLKPSRYNRQHPAAITDERGSKTITANNQQNIATPHLQRLLAGVRVIQGHHHLAPLLHSGFGNVVQGWVAQFSGERVRLAKQSAVLRLRTPSCTQHAPLKTPPRRQAGPAPAPLAACPAPARGTPPRGSACCAPGSLQGAMEKEELAAAP